MRLLQRPELAQATQERVDMTAIAMPVSPPDRRVTESDPVQDGALARSLAAVWKSHLDQESVALDEAIRPWALGRSLSAVQETYRQELAFGIASFLLAVAARPFARLYASSLLTEDSDTSNLQRNVVPASGRHGTPRNADVP